MDIREHLDNANAYLQSALNEPGHSPTEDALIDCMWDLITAFEKLLERTQ